MQLDSRARAAAAAAPWPRAAATACGGWMQRRQPMMGTEVSVQLWAEDRARGAAAMAAVMAEMQRIEHNFSPHRPGSELALVNAAAGSGAVPLSDEFYRLLVRALALSRLTQGAFDIGEASAGMLCDDRAGIPPGDGEPAAAARAIGWQALQLDPPARSLRFGQPGMRIDLGGFAQGHAVDRSCTILRRHGVRHAIVSAGGHSGVLGDRLGQPWTVAIHDPRDATQVVAVLPLVDTAVSTSRDRERGVVRDGVRHHLLDPCRSRSAGHLRSVTILAEDGLTSAALRKAVFVLGVDEGLAVVRAVPGADAMAVDDQGALHCTDGFATLAGGGGR